MQDFDGWVRLAAAVIASAAKDVENPRRSSDRAERKAQARLRQREQSARNFLAGDMYPYAAMVGLDPDTDQGFLAFCKAHGIERHD